MCTVLHWHEYRHVEKNEWWGNPKITPCMHVKWSSSGKDSFPTDGSGKTGHPHVEELNGPLCTEYHKGKLIPNVLEA